MHWISYPFPHLIIDNFLPHSDFLQLSQELDSQSLNLQQNFNTPAENKKIFLDSSMGKYAKSMIRLMGGSHLKSIISSQFNCDIFSMGDTFGYSGYSPYHITEDGGFLGSHVDHSDVSNGSLKHVANSIFYASSTWDKSWGGETILFSRNGLKQEVLIEPIPNRLVLFLHSSYSFHGVRTYNSSGKAQRRTFYHDYYVSKESIDLAIDYSNNLHSFTSLHSFHGTTFLPFIPFGYLSRPSFTSFIDSSQFKYLYLYLLYRLNRKLGTRLSTLNPFQLFK